MLTFLARCFKGLLAILLFALLSACQENQLVEVGANAPQIAVRNLEGDIVNLDLHAGKVTVLNFWQGGCVPCLDEMPRLQAVHEKFADQSVYLLSINQGGSAKTIKDAILETGVTFDFANDQLNVAATRYQVHLFPTTFVIDQDGVIRNKFIGEIDERLLSQAIDDLSAS